MKAPCALAALLLSAAVCSGPWAAETGAGRAAGKAAWYTDCRKAAARATRTGKPLLLYFTGSDWCDWCRTLSAEVFDTPEFAAWAGRSVVLVEVDFPKYARQAPALKKRNRALRKRFSDLVDSGFPTIVFLDPTGTRTLGELGYLDGGPAAWTDAADRILGLAR